MTPALRSAAPLAEQPARAEVPRPRTVRRVPPPPSDPDGIADGSQQRQAEIQLALAAQAARFDAMMKVLAEQQREINAIVDLGMAQTKRDDQLMNEWIRLI